MIPEKDEQREKELSEEQPKFKWNSDRTQVKTSVKKGFKSDPEFAHFLLYMS